MSLFTIGDLHLSFGTDKAMDVFSGWKDYVTRINDNWLRVVKKDDVVVIPGDLSWGMTLEQSLEDFRFVDALPGTKILLKGNHDYWWTTKRKMDQFFVDNKLSTLKILHNNYFVYNQMAICGTRGWINETDQPADAKVLAREAGRLTASLQSAKNSKTALTPVVFLHYPPIYASQVNQNIIDVLNQFSVKQCFYGHIHGYGTNYAINGSSNGIQYQLVSSDFLQFCPKRIG